MQPSKGTEEYRQNFYGDSDAAATGSCFAKATNLVSRRPLNMSVRLRTISTTRLQNEKTVKKLMHYFNEANRNNFSY